MSIHEIVLPETKPETEWVRGRALQKVSPAYDHSALQSELVIALRMWADSGSHGRVGTEWRFRVAPPRAVVRPLVPDVAFLSYDVLPPAARAEAQVPLGAPTVDPRKATITVHDHDGVRVLQRGDTLTHFALPGFALGVEELFERAMR